jgi:molybdenum-dependent DNA-binding transcriptional regulator ModE
MRWRYSSPNAAGAVDSVVVKRLYVSRIEKMIMKRQERIDRIELMRTFIRIVEAGSLSSAARQLDTTQATVSRRLQSLESMLGSRLILRTTHAMKLTDDGERCYQHARQVVDAWLALEDEMSIADDRPVGVLRVRAPHALVSSSCWGRWSIFCNAIRSWRWSGCSMTKPSIFSVIISIARFGWALKLTRPRYRCCWPKFRVAWWSPRAVGAISGISDTSGSVAAAVGGHQHLLST